MTAVKKIGYVIGGYPSPSATFTAGEILAVIQIGFEVMVFPVKKRSPKSIHGLLASLRPHVKGWYEDIGRFIIYNLIAPFVRPLPWMRSLHYAIASSGSSIWSLKRGATSAIRNLMLFPLGIYYGCLSRNMGIEHIHADFAGVPTTVAIIVSRYAEIGYSFSGHGFDLHFMPPPDLVARIKGARFFRTISDYNKRFLLAGYPSLKEEEIRVVRCGINPDYFTSGANRFKGKLRLLCVGRLVPVKGYQYLLEACTILNDAGLDYVLNIIGDGQLLKEMEEDITRRRLNEKVFLKGYRTQEEIREYYANSDIFVLSSISEGIPVVIMEAMASGLPVVATNITGVPEIVDSGINGYLVEPRNPEALAKAIFMLQQDPAKAVAFGKNGRKKVEELYDINKNGREMARMFTQGQLMLRNK